MYTNYYHYYHYHYYCYVRASFSTKAWVALPVQRYLSNAASCVFYGIACLTRLIEFAAVFATFEEHMC